VRAQGKAQFECLVAGAQTLTGFLLGELRARSELETPEGRAGFQTLAKRYVQQLAAPALRQQLVQAIAELARLAPDDARRFYAPEGGPAPAHQRPAPARAPSVIPRTEEQHLLRCVVMHPALAGELDETLLEPALPETEALKAIAADVAGGEATGGAALVERYQGTEFEKVVFRAQAAGVEQNDTAESATQEFRQALLALRVRRKHREIESVKGQVGTNPALNGQLDRLVKELHQLKAQRS
jgi:DNA primase